MNNKFDELAKGLAQSVTRRQGLKRLTVGLASMALAWFGLANKAEAGNGKCLQPNQHCTSNSQCCSGICAPDGQLNLTCGCSTDADCTRIHKTICCFGFCNPCQFP
jgi:hypothetical protein